MNNINLVTINKSNCVGCNACFNICPQNSIKMLEDEEGFFYPVINKQSCIDCGLCLKVCPSLHKSQVYVDNSENPDCYAAMGNNELRAISSSGGAFSVIADRIFNMGGVVCGAAFVGQDVRHIIIDNPSELHRLRGSKYLQSDTNIIFSQIKNILDKGRILLFTGTPCQVAGLNLFLGKKYDNLFTVDLLCHGVPSQKVFDKYLEETIKEGEFVHTSFRDKIAGWNVYATTTTTTTQYHETSSVSTYLQAFLKNMCLRPSCGTCKFTSTKREADITIGDFWAIERYKPSLNDKKGTSVILLNSEKGKALYNEIKSEFKIQEKVPIEYAKWFNISLYTTLRQHPKRHVFFKMLNEGKTLKEITDYFNSKSFDVGIINFWTFKNMGGVIQTYALQTVINQLGYTTCNINTLFSIDIRNKYTGSFVDKFARKHLSYTEPYYSLPALNKINEYFDTFVFGSDCIWGNWWTKQENCLRFFGNFIDSNKKIISYAPSFGSSTFNRANNITNIIRYYLKKFDAVSVREKSGVDILKNTFGIDGTLVLDPTLLLNADKYDELIRFSKMSNKNYIFNYSIGIKQDDIAYQEMIKKIEKEDIFALTQDKLDNINVEDWLYLIKNAKLLITNSYHACCFAIKFNVPFYIFSPYELDTTRFDSLLRILNLEDRILRSKEIVYNIKDVYVPIDWNNVNSIIKKEAERSISWLKEALETPKDVSKINPADDVINFLNSRISILEEEINRNNNILNVIDYKKNYNRYMLFRILKKLSRSHEKKQKYKTKQQFYYAKLKITKEIRKKNKQKSTIFIEDVIAILKKILKRK